jgi:succinate-acetate transporter protein
MAYEEENIETNTRARIYLQPIAAPSILGLYGFAAATWMVAANMVHWYGSEASAVYLFPFAALFGGFAQFLAGMWAFRARDGVATAMHGLWGSFWIAYGVLTLVFAVGKQPMPTGQFSELGYWFMVAAAITWVGAIAAGAENKGLSTTLMFLAAASTAASIGELAGVQWINMLGGYLFLISALCAFYTASALMLYEAYGREVWRIGRAQQARETPPISIGMGEPGVIKGQA